ncbi:MAG: response regulator [Candidatus Electryonea clarkiae]|nr:response regulator [Candidatus Electryonea clarkiae]MDP8286502.1 response regulator [Candidatus Electryonea clarkiae]
MTDDKKTILVVDDEEDVRVYFTTLFQDNGYDTIAASDGAEAQKAAHEHKPDLITLDITMPEESGLRAYRNLVENEATRDIPIIIITGISIEFKKFIHRGKQVPPPAGYFEKPVETKDLIAKVEELLAG